MNDASLKALREALAHSPDNAPLWRHHSETQLAMGRFDEAEREIRVALAKWPEDLELKLGLCSSFYRQGKNAEALVIAEALAKSGVPRALIMHARLLLRAGNAELAARQYRRALDDDPKLADDDLSERLGVRLDAAEDEDAEIVDGRVRAQGGETKSGAAMEIERPSVGFADVGGMENVKEEIRLKIIYPLTHPEVYKAYGKQAGGGILMYGPPGCGKTHLARATAGEVKAGFIAVGISDVLDMWIGQSERNLHEIFEQARASKPCVLFFDEVDALGASRTDMRQSAGRQLINQFLSELDGVQYSNEGVLILAATNAPWHLDSAFRRPGRFDRIIFVPPPDDVARAEILRLHTRGKPLADPDFEHAGKKLDGFSGADLKAVVDVAIEEKLREAMKTGKPAPLTTKDLLNAAKKQKPSTKEWFATAKNYALYSNQGGLYDDVLRHLKLK